MPATETELLLPAERRLPPFAVSMVYGALGLGWITAGDLAAGFLESDARHWLEPVKGAAFVIGSAVLLYFLLRSRVSGNLQSVSRFDHLRRQARRIAATFVAASLAAFGAGLLTVHQAAPDAIGPFLQASLLPWLIVAGGLVLFTARLHVQLNAAERISLRLERAQQAVIGSLSTALEQRDPYTAGHSARTGDIAVAIAVRLGLSEEQCAAIRCGAVLHDIGKFAVPVETLVRAGPLEESEREALRLHPDAGYAIVKDLDFGDWPVAAMVRGHHERLDGSGYPLGLKGEAIGIETRILAVADTVEAMAHDRPYRTARGTAAALRALRRGSGTLYDTRAVEACCALFESTEPGAIKSIAA
jgi:HD-GYP domain-containing protein (c-di-GMP phosphodiesterase class II)